MKKLYTYFDYLEDYIRGFLSHYPVVYAFVGGVGVVLFWKGVWETAESYHVLFGPVSIVISVAILLLSGLFVSYFIGDTIIISGLRREKKLVEKTESEVRENVGSVEQVLARLDRLEKILKEDRAQ